jgi:hypothetical protein
MPADYTTDLYFEAHITITPVFGETLELIKKLAAQYDFRVADLCMLKYEGDTPTPSGIDTFMTGRGKDFKYLCKQMNTLVEAILAKDIKVKRFKVENTLIDVRL